MKEKFIPGYEEKYIITTDGEVFNYKTKRKITPNNHNNYQRIELWKNGKRTSRVLHRLVMETFCPVDNMENLIVDHIDGRRDNNNINNLRWASPQENAIFKYENWDQLKDNFNSLLQKYGYKKLNEIFEDLLKK